MKCSRCSKMKPEVTKLNRVCQECRKGKVETPVPTPYQKK